MATAISIHLMFLLIRELDQEVRKQIDHFNTSHVSINPMEKRDILRIPVISIHLMFLLIKEYGVVNGQIRVFQYISCFY